MNPDQLSKLSSIAEILSSIAIVATLIFVLVEIRQNTQAIEQNAIWMRLASLDTGYDQTSEFRKMLLVEDDLFELWQHGCKAELDTDDETRFQILAVDWLIMMRNIGERVVALGGNRAFDAHIQATVQGVNRCPRIREQFEGLNVIHQLSPDWYSAVSQALE